MKTTFFFGTVMFMTLTSFNTRSDADAAAEKFGFQLVSALKNKSIEHFRSLYPPVEAYFQLMDENTALYGGNLSEAKTAFRNDYETRAISALNKSFEMLLSKGSEKGIEWRRVQFVRVERALETKGLEIAPLEIVFSHQEKEYHLVINHAIFFDGEWRVTKDMLLE